MSAPSVLETQGALLVSRCREALTTGSDCSLALALGSPLRMRQCEVRIFPEPAPDGGPGLVLVLSDITERFQAENRLAQSERQCAELLEREQSLRRDSESLMVDAQRASRMKDEFLATLSHELRTPLNAILGWTQTLRTGETGKETLARALAQIEQSARAQAKLVDDLLHISDIVAGRLRIEAQPMRLARSLTAVAETLRPAIDAKRIVLETSIDPSADIVRGDPARIQQVLWNLLANAVKFTQAGGNIRVSLSREGDHAVISVKDNGDGISAEFLPFVFDRFRQADASSRKRHGGLGLGLAIARYLIEMHGGTVQAHSEGLGTGADFRVRLPLGGPVEEILLTHVPDNRPAPPRRRRLTGLRILTVDDDGNTRDMLKEALTREGAEVLTAESACDAFQKLQDFRPDVLISDIGMPQEDGHDLLRQVRCLPQDHGGATPAIALTGYARDEDRAAVWQAGYQALTPKPVNLHELVATVVEVSRGRHP